MSTYSSIRTVVVMKLALLSIHNIACSVHFNKARMTRFILKINECIYNKAILFLIDSKYSQISHP